MQSALQTPSFMTLLFAARPPRRITRRYAAQVPQGATREIPRGNGRMTVHCRTGEAWITHDGDPRDVFLEATQSYTADHAERMTLHALRGDCLLEIEEELAS